MDLQIFLASICTGVLSSNSHAIQSRLTYPCARSRRLNLASFVTTWMEVRPGLSQIMTITAWTLRRLSGLQGAVFLHPPVSQCVDSRMMQGAGKGMLTKGKYTCAAGV